MAGNLYGSFVATTFVWDVDALYTTDVNSVAFKELLVRLYQNVNALSLSMNTRDAGIYDTQEFVNGQVFFPNPVLNSTSTTNPTQRQVFRKVINFGALPNTGATSVAHGIDTTQCTTFTRIYGCASDPAGFAYLPLPYASPTAANNIELSVSSANVTITTGSNRTAFTTCYVILEYLTC